MCVLLWLRGEFSVLRWDDVMRKLKEITMLLILCAFMWEGGSTRRRYAFGIDGFVDGAGERGVSRQLNKQMLADMQAS